MFSKQEAQELKKEFWIAFGKSFPRKWLLYDTKIKDFSWTPKGVVLYGQNPSFGDKKVKLEISYSKINN